jgi:hygromycin-B 7''-O-kinase
MTIRPDLQVSVAAAQSIVDAAFAGRTVETISSIHGGEIAAVYEIAFTGGQPSVVLKVYPLSLHWKMQKEANVVALIQDRLSVPVPRILLFDDTKTLLDLNFILMTKLDGVMLRRLEPHADKGAVHFRL